MKALYNKMHKLKCTSCVNMFNVVKLFDAANKILQQYLKEG